MTQLHQQSHTDMGVQELQDREVSAEAAPLQLSRGAVIFSGFTTAAPTG